MRLRNSLRDATRASLDGRIGGRGSPVALEPVIGELGEALEAALELRESVLVSRDKGRRLEAMVREIGGLGLLWAGNEKEGIQSRLVESRIGHGKKVLIESHQGVDLERTRIASEMRELADQPVAGVSALVQQSTSNEGGFAAVGSTQTEPNAPDPQLSENASSRTTNRLRTSCQACTASRKRCVAGPNTMGPCERCQRLDIPCERRIARRPGPPPKPKAPRTANRGSDVHLKPEVWEQAIKPVETAHIQTAVAREVLESMEGNVGAGGFDFSPEAPDTFRPFSSHFVPVPRHPIRNGLPDSATIISAAVVYFSVSETACPLLHPNSWFRNPQRTTLFTASFLLTMLYDAPTESVIASYKPLEWQIADVARRELFAFLGQVNRGAPITSEALAAVVNIAAWCLYKTRYNLARRVFDLLGKLLLRANYVNNLETMDDPFGPHTFRSLAEQRFGWDFYSRVLQPRELEELQKLWIAYWERRRIVSSWVIYHLTDRDWSRLVQVSPYSPILWKRPHILMPMEWHLSADPCFDPRLAPEEVEIGETFLLAFDLPRGHPVRQEMLARVAWRSVNLNYHLAWLRIELRNRVFCYLARCRMRGFASPASVPDLIEPGMPEEVVELIEERDHLDGLIYDIFDAFPRQVHDVVAGGSTNPLVQLILDAGGTELYAMNTIPLFFLIALLRLDLRSRLGILLASDLGELVNGLEGLAAEFARPEFTEFLGIAIVFTRVCRELSKTGPMPFWHYYVIYTGILNVCVLHLAVYKRLAASQTSPRLVERTDQQQNPESGLQAALAQVTENIESCIDVLGTLAIHIGTPEKDPDLKGLAKKLYKNEQVNAYQFGFARLQDDGLPERSEALGGFSRVVDVYLPEGGSAFGN